MTPPRRLRLFGWSASALAAVALAAWAGGARLEPATRLFLGLVVAGAGVLLVECLVLVAEPRRPSPAPRRPRRRPADGSIPIVPVLGMTGPPNPVDPRFRRFESREGPLDEARPGWAERGGQGGLLGEVVIVSLFVGRDGRRWSDDEIVMSLRALRRSAEWLERQAARWGADVNVALAEVYFEGLDPAEDAVEVQFVPEGDHMAPFEAGAVTKAIASASRAAASASFRDVGELMGEVAGRLDADHVVWVVQPRCSGRSLAIPEAESPLPGTAMSICYAKESNFPEPLDRPPFPDPTTFVHEILHLFGATDKYEMPLSTYPPSLVSDRDVMCLYQSGLPRLRVDRLTAQEIGWAGAPGRSWE